MLSADIWRQPWWIVERRWFDHVRFSLPAQMERWCSCGICGTAWLWLRETSGPYQVSLDNKSATVQRKAINPHPSFSGWPFPPSAALSAPTLNAVFMGQRTASKKNPHPSHFWWPNCWRNGDVLRFSVMWGRLSSSLLINSEGMCVLQRANAVVHTCVAAHALEEASFALSASPNITVSNFSVTLYWLWLETQLHPSLNEPSFKGIVLSWIKLY